MELTKKYVPCGLNPATAPAVTDWLSLDALLARSQIVIWSVVCSEPGKACWTRKRLPSGLQPQLTRATGTLSKLAATELLAVLLTARVTREPDWLVSSL